MTGHDPLCPLSDQSPLVMGADCPRCDEYALARADERERCKEGPWASEWAALALEVEAEVRERIARQIEAMTFDHAEGYDWLVREEVIEVIRGEQP